MNLATITMDPEQAEGRAEAYRRLKVPSVEEKAILAGYLALASGKPLINLADTVLAGGCDENGWPRLAVMTADIAWCHLITRPRRPGVQWEFVPERWMKGTQTRNRYQFEGPAIEDVQHTYGHVRAMVPIVPPDLRPQWQGRDMKLDNFVVLWEVEKWEPAPRPPGDPALLRHLAGDLYTVEAVWDLTPLEQAVLAGRNG